MVIWFLVLAFMGDNTIRNGLQRLWVLLIWVKHINCYHAKDARRYIFSGANWCRPRYVVHNTLNLHCSMMGKLTASLGYIREGVGRWILQVLLVDVLTMEIVDSWIGHLRPASIPEGI